MRLDQTNTWATCDVCWCGEPSVATSLAPARWRLCWRAHEFESGPSPWGVSAEEFGDALVRMFVPIGEAA